MNQHLYSFHYCGKMRNPSVIFQFLKIISYTYFVNFSFLKTLVTFSQIDSTDESEVILISDGENGAGNLDTATQSLVDAGVVVHCIAVTQEADARLEEISKGTDGRCFAYTEAGSVSLSAVLSEIIFGGSVSSSSAATTVNTSSDTLILILTILIYII